MEKDRNQVNTIQIEESHLEKPTEKNGIVLQSVTNKFWLCGLLWADGRRVKVQKNMRKLIGSLWLAMSAHVRNTKTTKRQTVDSVTSKTWPCRLV